MSAPRRGLRAFGTTEYPPTSCSTLDSGNSDDLATGGGPQDGPELHPAQIIRPPLHFRVKQVRHRPKATHFSVLACAKLLLGRKKAGGHTCLRRGREASFPLVGNFLVRRSRDVSPVVRFAFASHWGLRQLTDVKAGRCLGFFGAVCMFFFW